MKDFTDFCKEHRWAIICVLAGLALLILLLTIGLWKTLLVLAVLGICLVIGVLLDKDGPEGVKNFFNNLFAKGKKS